LGTPSGLSQDSVVLKMLLQLLPMDDGVPRHFEDHEGNGCHRHHRQKTSPTHLDVQLTADDKRSNQPHNRYSRETRPEEQAESAEDNAKADKNIEHGCPPLRPLPPRRRRWSDRASGYIGGDTCGPSS